VKEGMLSARGQHILMMDADGATKVSDLDKLEEKLSGLSKAKGATGKGGAGNGALAAMVYGSRHHLQAKVTRKFVYHPFQSFIVSLLLLTSDVSVEL
jgi:dolichyl-phosphate beta-glucosyltransferase